MANLGLHVRALASDEYSVPLTLCHALVQVYGLAVTKAMTAISVHILNPHGRELCMLDRFEVLAHWLPQLKDLHIVSTVLCCCAAGWMG